MYNFLGSIWAEKRQQVILQMPYKNSMIELKTNKQTNKKHFSSTFAIFILFNDKIKHYEK